MPTTSVFSKEIFKKNTVASQSRTSSLRKSSALILLGVLITYGIFILKVQIFHSPPAILLLVYSVVMTSFQFGRLLTVLFYEESLEKVAGKNSTGDFNGFADSSPYEPTVSFVIPCMNEEKAIRNTVNKCFAVDYPSHKVEVLVVDDGSTDKTPKILDDLSKENKRLTVVKFAKNRGKRHAMVEGFRRAKGEIIVQLDSDSHLAKEGLRPLVEPFRNPSVGAVCAHADPANVDKNFITKMQAAYYYMSFRILKAVESTFYAVFCCSGCASAYRKSAVLSVLDEWSHEKFLGLPVMYGDDRSLTTHVMKAGYKTIYTADAQAYTIVPETFRQLIIQQVRWKKSWIINAVKTGKFIIGQKPLVAILYFYPLIILSILNPFVALYALIYVPAVYGILPIFYLAGIFLITALIAVYYKVYGPQNRYWPYLFAWGAFSVAILAPLLFYAAARIQNRSWGTR